MSNDVLEMSAGFPSLTFGALMLSFQQCHVGGFLQIPHKLLAFPVVIKAQVTRFEVAFFSSNVGCVAATPHSMYSVPFLAMVLVHFLAFSS